MGSLLRIAHLIVEQFALSQSAHVHLNAVAANLLGQVEFS